MAQILDKIENYLVTIGYSKYVPLPFWDPLDCIPPAFFNGPCAVAVIPGHSYTAPQNQCINFNFIAAIGGSLCAYAPHYNIHYTFSYDASSGLTPGDFTLIPYDFNPDPPNINTIAWYDVSAIGCELNGIPYWPTHTHTLKRIHFGYDNYISDKTIGTTDYEKNLQGWNTLTTENITYQSGVTAEVKARTEVHLLPPFDANYGSEVHIYTGETFADCDAFYNGNMRTAGSGNATPNNEIKKNEIELHFAKPKAEFSFSVVPNPSHDKFTISINCDVEFPLTFTLSDALGSILQKDLINNATFTIEASNFKRGVYYLKINSNTKKLVVL